MKKHSIIILSIIQLFCFNLFSQNRGNWSDISPYPAHDIANGYGFVFFNKDTGYVYTQENISGNYLHCLLQTNDGGKNWTTKKVVVVGESNCKFFNKNLGFYKSGNKVYKTIDGGDSFDVIKTFPYPYTSQGDLSISKSAIFISDCETSSVMDSVKTFIGKDFGSSWQVCYDTLLWGIRFVDSLNGYAIKPSKPPFLLKTNDGGEHWIKTYKLPNLGKLKFVTIDTGYIIGNSKIYISTNSGQTWDSIMNGIHNSQCYDIACINSKTCFIAGYNLIQRKFEIYKTSNAGASWKSISELYHFTKSSNTIQCTVDTSQGTIITVFVGGVNCAQRTPFYKASFDPEEIWGDIENPINSVLKFELYPNPSNGIISTNLQLNQVEDLTLCVIDALGKTVLNSKLNNFKEGIIPIDLSNYSGIFFCTIKTEKEIVSKKIIITK